MRKPRYFSPFDKLTAEAQTRLDEMLFVKNMTYHAVLEVFDATFGFATSYGALAAYYKKRSNENLRTAVAIAAEESTVRASGVEITITCKSPGEVRLAIRPLQ